MILARIFSRIYKEGGIILIDAKGQKYICGNPSKEKPVTLKLLKENLKWKLLIDPELEFPEAYMRNEIIIENSSLKDFLMDLIKNLGRNEVTTASFITKKIFQVWRHLTNFNLWFIGYFYSLFNKETKVILNLWGLELVYSGKKGFLPSIYNFFLESKKYKSLSLLWNKII